MLPSNGPENYISAIAEHSDFGELFTDLYSAGRFQTKTKVDLVAKLLRRLSCYNRATWSENRKSGCRGRESRTTCRLSNASSSYGGQKELEGATHIIESFSELPVQSFS